MMVTMTRKDIISGEFFHVLNRGVEQRNLFLSDKDFFRFIHNLFEFNDIIPAANLGYHFNQKEFIDLRKRYLEKRPRKQIIEILAFCLMPNHFHLLLRQKQKGGITKFMRKLDVGYANYFNKKYQRSGTLFQGRYKIIPIKKDSHLLHLPYYIHFNPLDLIFPEWREGKIQNYKKAIDFLKSYRWSSHLDYLDINNFPSITNRVLLLKMLGGSENYRKRIKNWLKEMGPVKFQDLILE